MDWLIENWQLIASVVLALVNFIITLLVHRTSTHRITDLNSNANKTVLDLSQIVDFNNHLIEILGGTKKDETSNQQKGEQ